MGGGGKTSSMPMAPTSAPRPNQFGAATNNYIVNQNAIVQNSSLPTPSNSVGMLQVMDSGSNTKSANINPMTPATTSSSFNATNNNLPMQSAKGENAKPDRPTEIMAEYGSINTEKPKNQVSDNLQTDQTNTKKQQQLYPHTQGAASYDDNGKLHPAITYQTHRTPLEQAQYEWGLRMLAVLEGQNPALLLAPGLAPLYQSYQNAIKDIVGLPKPETKLDHDIQTAAEGIVFLGAFWPGTGKVAAKSGELAQRLVPEVISSLKGLYAKTALKPDEAFKIITEYPHLKDALLNSKGKLSPEIMQEMKGLSKAYKDAKKYPLGKDLSKPAHTTAEEVLAVLKPEGLKQIFAERGSSIMKNGQLIVQGKDLKKAGLSEKNFGLVKIIFLHGEKGNKNPVMPIVTETDVINLPIYLRSYEGKIEEGGKYVWNIPRQDGNHLRIVLGDNEARPNMRLISMYVTPATKPTATIKRTGL